MKPIIKKIEKNDYKALSNFFEKNNVPEITKYFNPFPLNAKSAYKIAHLNKQNKYYLMFQGEKIIGFGMLRWWENYDIPTYGVLIDRRHQKRGFGKIMTKFVLEEAKKIKCNGVWCSVNSTNLKSLNMFKSCGFRKVGKKIIEKKGNRITKIILEKKLDN